MATCSYGVSIWEILMSLTTLKHQVDRMITDDLRRHNAHMMKLQYDSKWASHCCDVIIGAVASQITSLTIVYSTVYSDADQRIHQSSASLSLLRGIHRRPVNSPHKWPVMWKMFPFDDVIMFTGSRRRCWSKKNRLSTSISSHTQAYDEYLDRNSWLHNRNNTYCIIEKISLLILSA